MGRRSVQVSPDVRLLNSGELEEVSAGHLRAVPRSHSHPFVTICSKIQPPPPVGAAGTLQKHGIRGMSGMWGQAPYPGERPITGLELPVCGMQLR